MLDMFNSNSFHFMALFAKCSANLQSENETNKRKLLYFLKIMNKVDHAKRMRRWKRSLYILVNINPLHTI